MERDIERLIELVQWWLRMINHKELSIIDYIASKQYSLNEWKWRFFIEYGKVFTRDVWVHSDVVSVSWLIVDDRIMISSMIVGMEIFS